MAMQSILQVFDSPGYNAMGIYAGIIQLESMYRALGLVQHRIHTSLPQRIVVCDAFIPEAVEFAHFYIGLRQVFNSVSPWGTRIP